MNNDPEKLTADLQTAMTQAREVLAEVRGVQRDIKRDRAALREEMKEFKNAIKIITQEYLRDVRSNMENAVAREVALVRDSMQQQMDAGTQEINDTFRVIKQYLVDFHRALERNGIAGMAQWAYETRDTMLLVAIVHDDDEEGDGRGAAQATR